MIKRILVIVLVLLLCIPCLGVLAMAATEYSFVTSADSDFMFMGSIDDIPPPGKYSLTVTIDFFGNPVTHKISMLDIVYSPMEMNGMPAMAFVYIENLNFAGANYQVVLQLGYIEAAGISALNLMVDGVAVPASFTFTYLSSAAPQVYNFSSGVVIPGDALPFEGQYNLDVTIFGVTDTFIVDIKYEQYGGQKAFLQGFSKGNRSYSLLIMYEPGVGTSVQILDSFDNVVSGDIVLNPLLGYNTVPVLLASIGLAISSLVQWFGIVISSFLTSEGALVVLWPLVGLGLCIALVFAGVGLIRKFSP